MKIVFDAERMKYPFTGLFEYCLQLGESLLQIKPDEDELAFYIPQENEQYFGQPISTLKQKSIHKFIDERKFSEQYYSIQSIKINQ